MKCVSSAVQGIDVPRCYGHDDKMLRQRRCATTCTVWPFSDQMGERCVTLRMKILPIFGWCWRRQGPWASFPSLESSLKCAPLVWIVVSGRKPRFVAGPAMAASFLCIYMV